MHLRSMSVLQLQPLLCQDECNLSEGMMPIANTVNLQVVKNQVLGGHCSARLARYQDTT
jgi:hypothetical protein